MACPPRVSAALKSIPGVQAVEVSYPKKQAVVLASPEGCNADAHKAMSAALQKAGYGGEVSKIEPGT